MIIFAGYITVMGIFDKGVQKTNRNFFQRLSRAIAGRSRVDDDVLDAMEEALLSSDMGVDTTLKLLDNLEETVEKDKYMSMDELVEILRGEIALLLDAGGDDSPVQPFDFSKKPYVMLVVGVNGVGKTTTIGKLASMLRAMGKKVVVGAADTFRAAAVEQLTLWAVPLIDNINAWTLNFIVGKKDINKDWDEYVASCKNLNVDKVVDLTNKIYKGQK